MTCSPQGQEIRTGNPENRRHIHMKELTVRQIADAVGGKVICGRPAMTVSRVSRDSRDVDGRTLFFALRGENRDGHSFIRDVVGQGCTALIISDEESLKQVENEYVTAVLVEDTTKALQILAAWYLRELDITVVGITGSVGKTTTKDLLYAACREKYKTGATKGNYNNHIGLPLTVLYFDEDVQVGVLEMGMDKYGEIDFLAGLARPHIAVITCIGSAHIEFFGSRENIMKAKMEITNYLQPSDTLVISKDGDLLRPENVKGDYRLVTSGEDDDSDYVVSGIVDNGAAGMEFDLKNMWMTQHFMIPAAGRHNVLNAAVAAAAAGQLNITMEEAARGMAKAEMTGKRLAFKRNENKKIDIIDDTYNASPEAMKAAIDQLMAVPGERKIAILGDMYELGDSGEELHREIGRYAEKKGVDLVLGVGPLGSLIAGECDGRGRAYETKKELKKDLKKILLEGDTILVKASRGMALDEIAEELLK